MTNQTTPSTNGDYIEDVNHVSRGEIGYNKLSEEF